MVELNGIPKLYHLQGRRNVYIGGSKKWPLGQIPTGQVDYENTNCLKSRMSKLVRSRLAQSDQPIEAKHPKKLQVGLTQTQLWMVWQIGQIKSLFRTYVRSNPSYLWTNPNLCPTHFKLTENHEDKLSGVWTHVYQNDILQVENQGSMGAFW
jgi:hypothetical protein